MDEAAVVRAAQGCQVIHHCAALVGIAAYAGQPTRTMEVEEQGLRNACLAARLNKVPRLVYASSSAVYGHAGGPEPLLETQEVSPVSNYGVAKRFNETYLAAQAAEHGLHSAALRIFNVYGPRQNPTQAVPAFITRALGGEPITIFGDGQQTRDFIYVADVVQAAIALGRAVEGAAIVNAASGAEVSVRSLAETVVRLTGSVSPIHCLPRPEARDAFEVARCFGSRALLERLTDAPPPLSLEDGLSRTISAMRGEI